MTKKTPEIPVSISRSELAKFLGISTRAVNDHALRGNLVRAPQAGRFLFQESVQKYTASLRDQAMGRSTATGTTLQDERAKTEAVNREIAEIKLAQLRAENLTYAEVSESWSNLASMLKQKLLALPSKARSTIPHLTAHDGQTLNLLIRDVLSELADEVESGAVIGASPEKIRGR